MTVPEFENNLKTIHQLLFTSEAAANPKTTESYFEALDPFIHTPVVAGHPFFLSRENTADDAIEFIMNTRAGDQFRVNKNEWQHHHDPVPAIKLNTEWQSYDFNLSTLLLTEYVHWLSKQTSHQFDLPFSGYAIYVPIKKHWDQFFNPFSYPNKIWIGKEIKSIIYIQNETGTLTCMTNDLETLKQAQELLIEK